MTTSNERMLGLMHDMLDDEKKVSIEQRQWTATRRLLARMMVSWRHCLRESRMIVESCRHADDCPTLADPARSCAAACPDRETYLSARVLLASSFEFAGALELPSMRATEYLPPTREYFDRVLGELEALRAARDWLEELGAAVPLESAGAAVTQIAGVLPMAERPISRLLADPAYPAPAPVAPTLDDDQDTGEEIDE